MNAQRAVTAFLFLVSCMFSSVLAADDQQTYLVAYAKFKPGKAPEALKIIHEHFWPVDRTIGRRAMPFDFSTGEWDHVVYFPYDTARMDTIPPAAEWWKALAIQEGGVEQAQRLFQSFLDLQANSKFEIARSPGPLMGNPNR
jgi:hypothetical protein